MRWLWRGLPVLAAALLAGCTTTPKIDCAETSADCTGISDDCRPSPPECMYVAAGASFKWVDIDSSPTPAAIYVNGKYVGETPLRYPLVFTSLTRYVVVVAEPLYSTQTRQEQHLSVPPLPGRIQFFMNNAEQAGTPER